MYFELSIFLIVEVQIRLERTEIIVQLHQVLDEQTNLKVIQLDDTLYHTGGAFQEKH